MVEPDSTPETEMDYEKMARAFKALGHPARLAILMRTVESEFCVSELQEHLDRSQANVSQHLAVLRDRGLVNAERDGNRVCYRVADERVADIIRRLAEIMQSESETKGAGEQAKVQGST